MIEPYYQDDCGITLYCGDCADIAPQLGLFDLLLTDPPYGIDIMRPNGTGRARSLGSGSARCGNAPPTVFKVGDWDKEPPPPELMTALMKQAKHHIIWGGNYFNVPPSKCWLVWDKDNSGDFADCELAYTNLDMAVRMKTWRWNGMLQQDMKNKETRLHPTQNPVPVLEWCLSFVPSGTVFDPFAGSGTTGVACKRKRRRCVMIERDPDYCAIAAKRLRETQPLMDFDAAPSAYTEEMRCAIS